MNGSSAKHPVDDPASSAYSSPGSCVCLWRSVSDSLPREAKSSQTTLGRLPAIWPQRVANAYTTLFGFGLGIVIGISARMLIGSSRLATTWHIRMWWLLSIPKVDVVTDLRLWFALGHRDGGPDVHDRALPNRRECGHRALPQPSPSCRM